MITNCAGQCAESVYAFAKVQVWARVTGNCAAVANAMDTYLSANNYANANTIITGSVLSLVFNLGLTPVQYYINAGLDYLHGKTNNDACGESKPATYTGDAASAIYDFCLAIQNEVESEVTTRFDAADTTSGSATSSNGIHGLAKFFISSQKFQWGPVCSDFGITWKRGAQLVAGLTRAIPFIG
jgi:hypothetical protein